MARSRLSSVAFAAVAASALAGGSPRRALAVEGAVQNPNNGHWYLHVAHASRTAWKTCKAEAQAMGGYLATITSPSEQQWVYANVVAGKGHTFLGGTDEASEGTWEWITGEAWTYSNWGSGDPNNWGGVEHYLLYGGNLGSYWFDIADYELTWNVSAYVVEWNGDPNAPVIVQPPSAPTQLSASYDDVAGVTLSWTDGSSDEAGFTIERKPAGYAFARRDATEANVVSYADHLLFPSTTYTYRVRAFNSGGDSAWSNEASITTSAGVATPQPPLAPSRLTAAPYEAAIDLAWTDGSVDETLFGLERAEGGAPFVLRTAAPAGTVEYEDVAIRPGWPYTYRVRALSLQGPSPYSNTAVASIPATLTVTPGASSLTDSAKLHKDKLKIAATLADDEALDVVANGIALQAGPSNAPVAISIPPGDAAWRTRRSRLTWKTPKGAAPKAKVVYDSAKHVLTVTASGFDFAAPPSDTIAVLVASGESGGAGTANWAGGRPFHLR
jgi:hypothetical protein